MRFSLIPFFLLIVPVAEIAIFILVGNQINLLPTLGLIVVTAVIGSIMLRFQGFGIVNRMRASQQEGKLPSQELAHAALIAIAGILLLTPGFLTDTIGFLLFIPKVRDIAWRSFQKRFTIVTTKPPHSHPADKNTIELDSNDYHRNQ